MPDEKAMPIVDPKVEWKIPNILWLTEKAKEAKEKEKNRIRINNHEHDEHDEDFIIDIIGDSNLRNAMLENDDFVDFEETHSHDDVQLHLGFDRRPDIGLNSGYMTVIYAIEEAI